MLKLFIVVCETWPKKNWRKPPAATTQSVAAVSGGQFNKKNMKLEMQYAQVRDCTSVV
jgi:hypothetical protein